MAATPTTSVALNGRSTPNHAPIRRNRLPTLMEVLTRATRSPCDLYGYYIFLQNEGSEDILDFWLDVHQHENLVRAYFKDLQKTGRSVREEWPRYYEVAKKRGSAWNGLNGVTRDRQDDQDIDEDEGSRVAADQNNNVHNAETETRTGSPSGEGRGASHDGFLAEGRRTTLSVHDAMEQARYSQRTPSPTSNGPRPNYNANFSPTLRALYPHDADIRTPSPSSATPGGAADIRNEASMKRRSLGAATVANAAASIRGRGKNSSTLPYISRDTAITRTDLIASAERIYARYLQPGAEKEIYLPNVLRVNNFPISAGELPSMSHTHYDAEADILARVPDMFHSQKEWTYRAMEQDSFPRFLRAKAFGNITPVSALVRLCIGLLVLWIALSTAFSFVFLDVPRKTRLWIILPFSLAILLILSYAYDLDPLMVFYGVSETTTFRTLKIREPYVKKLLWGRSLWVTFLTVVTVACSTVLFTLVPGHRL